MSVVKVSELTKRYKNNVALDNFNLTVEEGEILGFLGPNGCGKTTAINCILGVLTFDRGTVEVFEETMGPDKYQLKQQIGLVPQELAYLDNLTVIENIDFFCGLYVNDSARRQELVREAIAFVGLEGYEKYFPKKLSGGLKRRLNIACGIAHQPRLIILDEPTVAVDAQSRNFILEGIKALNAKGSTVIYTTHYLDEAEFLCDRIVIMDKGHQIGNGTLDDLINLLSVKEVVEIDCLGEPKAEFVQAVKQIHSLLTVDVDDTHVRCEFKQAGQNLLTVASLLEQHQQTYAHIYSKKPSLNDVFLTLTGKELRE